MINDTPTIQEKIKEYKAEQQAFKEQEEKLNKNLKDLINFFSKEFFLLVPEVKSISWCQYTPYFNDGDACEFRVNEIFFANFIPNTPSASLGYQLSQDDIKNGQWAYTMNSLKDKNILSPDKISICDAFDDILYFNDDGLYEMFDDHVIVQITSNGIETTEYEHD